MGRRVNEALEVGEGCDKLALMEAFDMGGASGRYFKPVVLALIGLFVAGVGVFATLVWKQDQVKVEVLKPEKGGESRGETPKKLVVEMAGSVVSPGVYNLDDGSRVEDGLIAAGGFSAVADREWVEKYVNRAEKLVDGAKIYIPAQGEMEKVAFEGASTAAPFEEKGKKININSASKGELESLWGVGPATAEKIISGRPYQSIEELLTRKVLKTNVFEAIKDQLAVF